MTDYRERPCRNALCTVHAIPCSGHDQVLRMLERVCLAVGAGVIETCVGVCAKKVIVPCFPYRLVVLRRQAGQKPLSAPTCGRESDWCKGHDHAEQSVILRERLHICKLMGLARCGNDPVEW